VNLYKSLPSLTIVGLVTLAVPMQVGAATVVRCEVVRRISGCDYFMVQTRQDYAVLEWYGGHDPDKGDVMIGNVNSYGFKNFIYADDDDKTTKVYVEDYGLNREDALDKLIEECE
jgi:hypothetical protein